MKKTRRVFALLLTLAMAMALCVPVFAAETGNSAETVANGDKVIVPLNADDIVDFSDVISEMPPIVLGTPDMAEYDDSPNIQTRASGFLFSMTANAVYELLVTGSAKTFTESDLDNNYLYISGELSHSYGSDASIKIGGCYYDASSGLYVADLYAYVYEGSISRKINTQFAIAKEYTHRGFIKNQAGVGYVSGNLSFYSKA